MAPPPVCAIDGRVGWKPLGEEITPSESPVCVWTVCQQWHSGGPECAWPVTQFASGCTTTGVSKGGHKESLISYLPPCWCKKSLLCCLCKLRWSDSTTNARTVLRLTKPPWVPASLCANLLLVWTRGLLQCAPQPSFEAKGCKGWPFRTLSGSNHHFRWTWRDFGKGMTFSRTSGTCQCFFKCHWMGLMCKRPDTTCFSVAVRRPIRDMNCLTEQVSCPKRRLIFCDRAIHLSWHSSFKQKKWKMSFLVEKAVQLCVYYIHCINRI